MRIITQLALGLFVTLSTALVAGAPAAAKKGPTVAVFPIATRLAALKPLAEALERSLANKAKAAHMNVVTGATLERRTKGANAGDCDADTDCLAKLGRRAKADRILWVRAEAAGGGGRFEVQLVDVANGNVLGRAVLELRTTEQVPLMLSAQFAEIFGIADPSAPAADDLAMPELEDLALEPVANAEPADSDDSADSAPADEPDLMALVALEPPPAGDSSGGDTTPTHGDATTDAAILQATQQPDATSEPAAGASPALFYAGVSLGAAGLVAVGIGGVFGLLRNDAESATTTGNPSQIEVDRLNREGTAHAMNANILWGAGGGAAAIGAVLILIDLLSDDGPAAETDVKVSATANGFAVAF